MEENAKKRKIIIISLAVFIVVVYGAIFAMVDKKNQNRSLQENIEIVTDYSEFYTVDACANKYMNYLSSKDTASLLKLLSPSYVKKNAITENNVLNFLPVVTSGTAFSTKEMHRVELKDGLYKFYLFGYFEVGGMDITDISRTPGYMIVYLDKKDNLFQIEPYDGKYFKEGEL